MSRYSAKQYANALFDSLSEKAIKPDVLVKRFAEIVVKNYDRSLLPKIVMQFKKLERTHGGAHEVLVTSARPLEKTVLKEVQAKVGANSRIIEIIDPSVLGGMKVLVNDELVIDGTFKTRIARLVEVVVNANT